MIQDDVESWAIREAGVVTAGGAGGELPTQQGHSAPGQVRLGRGHHGPPAPPASDSLRAGPQGSYHPPHVSWPRIHPRVGVGVGAQQFGGAFWEEREERTFQPNQSHRWVQASFQIGLCGNKRWCVGKWKADQMPPRGPPRRTLHQPGAVL